MMEAELECAVYGESSVFPVKIALNAKVRALQEAIVKKKKADFNARFNVDPSHVKLYLARDKDGNWVEDDEQLDTMLQGDIGTEYVQMLSSWRLNKKELFGTNSPPTEDVIHVLVKLPSPPRMKAGSMAMPRLAALFEPEKFTNECICLPDWDVGTAHELPTIATFMKHLGGCTANGKFYWRLEDKQVASILLGGWFGWSTTDTINPGTERVSIVMGSPGVGKSTLLCLMAFHLVCKHHKNVLVYRKLDRGNCLLNLGNESGKIVWYGVRNCLQREAIDIYDKLRRQQGFSNVWLLLDGIRHGDIPEGLRSYKMLATSQQVVLRSQESTYAYCCLLPCWSKADLFALGEHIYGFSTGDMDERFYYSGGSVREFTRATTEAIRDAIDNATSLDGDASFVLSNSSSGFTGHHQVDHLRHTFVQDASDTGHFLARRHWEPVIDSEYAVFAVWAHMQLDALLCLFRWAKHAGHRGFAGNVFELYVHRLAADNMLRLCVAEYDPPERRPSDQQRHLDIKQVQVKRGAATCCGTATDYEWQLKEWQQSATATYWFPACHDFPNIDSIVKIETLPQKTLTYAYFQMTIEAEHEINAKQLQKMNEIFYPANAKCSGRTERPVYIVVCPDLESCKSLVLTPGTEVLAAREQCQVFVGYHRRLL